MKKRLRNYGLWLSIASLTLLLLQTFGVDVSPDKYNQIVNTVLSVLTLAGILNNPTTAKKGFGDDK